MSMCYFEWTIMFILLMTPLVDSQSGFYMVNITTVPRSGPNHIVPENQTLYLYGQSSQAWTLCSLYFKDKFLCRNRGELNCDASLPPNTTRLRTITAKQMVDKTWCGFQVPFLSNSDSGKWKISMTKLDNTLTTDDEEATIVVSTKTTLQLSLSTTQKYSGLKQNTKNQVHQDNTRNETASDNTKREAVNDYTKQESIIDNTKNKVDNNSNNKNEVDLINDNIKYDLVKEDIDVCSKSTTEVTTGNTLLANCTASGGLPRIKHFSWTVRSHDGNGTVQWNMTYSQVQQTNQQTSQVATAVPQNPGSFILSCSVEQTGYYSAVSSEAEVLVSSPVDPDDGIIGGNLNKFTITLIVLGVIFFFIIIIWLIAALVTGTFCFAENKSKVHKDEKKIVKKDDNTIRKTTDENNAVVNTNYVVGQDFRENDPRSSQASESLPRQYQQGMSSGFISASQYKQGSSQYSHGSGQLDESGDINEPKNFQRNPQLYSGQPSDSLRRGDRGHIGYTEQSQHRGALV